MNLGQAVDVARHLLTKYKLSDWDILLTNSEQYAGTCCKEYQTITLSIPHILNSEYDEVKDTILHEIAHALCPEPGHGEAWKKLAVKLGAKPFEEGYKQEVFVNDLMAMVSQERN